MSENDTTMNQGFWTGFFRELLPIEQRSLLGTLVFFMTIIALGWVGVNEPHRMSGYTAQYDGRSIQRGASLFADNCATCHGADGEGQPSIAPALNYEGMFNGTRTQEVAWAGTVRDYVHLTVAAGRPAKSDSSYANPMPTWSQEYGGPLRPDQVEDLTNFVMNWGCRYDEACAGADYATPGPSPTPPPPTATPEPIDVCEVLDGLPAGDPARGEGLVMGTEMATDGVTLACNACHTLDGSTLVGPSYQGLSSRIPPADWSPMMGSDCGDPVMSYLVESIWEPAHYVVVGFESQQMPVNFSVRMTDQDLADIMAFLLTVP